MLMALVRHSSRNFLLRSLTCKGAYGLTKNAKKAGPEYFYFCDSKKAGLHFSHPHRELSIERDLTLLSIGVAAYA